MTIRGHGAERNLPVARPTVRRHERPGFRPDRAALWAVILGLVLILVAVASAHGAGRALSDLRRAGQTAVSVGPAYAARIPR